MTLLLRLSRCDCIKIELQKYTFQCNFATFATNFLLITSIQSCTVSQKECGKSDVHMTTRASNYCIEIHMLFTWGEFCLGLGWTLYLGGVSHFLANSLVVGLTLSLLRVINVKIPLQPHKKYDITQYGELDFSWLTQMKSDYTTNSRYITHTIAF